ncbi:MAG: hypothetical protein ACI97B_001171, partial [Verrucomicrobiales bacterium]
TIQKLNERQRTDRSVHPTAQADGAKRWGRHSGLSGFVFI